MNWIPYGRQSISEADIEAVVKALRSDWLTQGPNIELFEQSVAEYCGARYAVAVSSATAGLHLACLAAGLQTGDVLWTSPITFVASANCALYCGAEVDFVDIDPLTYNLSLPKLRLKLEQAAEQGRLPKIVVPVHLAGQACELQEMRKLADQYGFVLLEDAAHAIGGEYQAARIGSCAYSDMTVFSFHPVKIVTSGEGGMILTNQKELWQKLQLLRSHGITRDPEQMSEPAHGDWYYEQLELGFHYRMTDLQAALGASQMQKIESFVKRRRELAARYQTELADLPLRLPWQHPDTHSAWHLYIIRLDPELTAVTRDGVFKQMREAGIGVQVHYIPVHLQPFYRKFGFQAGDFPEAEAYYKQGLSLPIYYELSDIQQDVVIEKLRALLT